MESIFKQDKFSESIKVKMFNTMAEEKRRIGLREFAKQIGISTSTLSRVENGKQPDIETFFKICYWMKKSSNEFYNH
jgi:transcriptional regulator with XRE-family HTH domain